MKFLIPAILIASMFLLINQASASQWNIFVYGLFAAFTGFKSYKALWVLYQFKKGRMIKGEIIDAVKEDPNEVADINYDTKIRFICPYDNREYIIYQKLDYLPKEHSALILVNAKSPRRSKAYLKFNFLAEGIIIIGFVFFCFLLVKTIVQL